MSKKSDQRLAVSGQPAPPAEAGSAATGPPSGAPGGPVATGPQKLAGSQPPTSNSKLHALLRSQGVPRSRWDATLALLSDTDRAAIEAGVDDEGRVSPPAAAAYRDALARRQAHANQAARQKATAERAESGDGAAKTSIGRGDGEKPARPHSD